MAIIRDFPNFAKPLTCRLRGKGGRESKNELKNKLIKLDDQAFEVFKKKGSVLISNKVILNYPDFEKSFN